MSWGRDWPLWLWAMVNALAVYRLTRLAVADTVTQPFRRWLAGRFEGPLVELWFCAWCMSVWVATGVVALTWFVPFAWSLAGFALALSAAAGYLLTRARDDLRRFRRSGRASRGEA